MRSVAPALLPVLRSRHQADLLTALLLHPEREYTQTELAELVSTPLTTVAREVERLVETAIVTKRRVGRAWLLRANERSPYVRPLTELIMLAFGPHVVIGEEFAGITGADAVAIYGSWAARYQGEPGPPPNDLDVLVIGRPARDDLYAAAERAEQRLSTPVNPTLCSPRRWRDSGDPFVRQLRSAPLIWIHGAADEVA
ncbi:MAG TPA: winged helix-turn-helix domain-containing protein [Actinophytocola sp.]|uniref:winged helix-turn-helix domain-containing protein n=1 Tax=Actinophytocola sp. TaxID=1872138 RepID=UPI002DC02880|nr:winged helix-turn-helix domain-containing protein [Actinophytocola sp.]HEU5471566.1 winged helix-turn-helix domain-containing protein [Actinophytocola sp.]